MAYIDKELFKQDIKMRYCNNCANPNEIKCRGCNVDDLLGEIEDAPTADVVEVFRCKDCKKFIEYSDDYKFKVEGADGDCHIRLMHSTDNQFCAVKYDDFCSYGRRK
jgi:hypothetical protein